MKKFVFVVSCFLAAICLWSWRISSTDPVTSQNTLPGDALNSCPLPSSLFNSWFAAGKPSVNGLVLPASSVAFVHNNNCDFYKWSEQMFLWLTSPTGSGSGSVLESPLFFDVSTEDANHQRTLIPHLPGSQHIFNMSSHIVKEGPNHLPVVKSATGKLFEVEISTLSKAHPVFIKNAEGKRIVLSRVEKSSGGVNLFYDASNNKIVNPKAALQHEAKATPVIQEIISGNDHFYLAADGSPVQVEEGQATGDVLMSQNGSLVYYLLLVNDVYAYFKTGVATGNLSDSAQFPATGGAMDSIAGYYRKVTGNPLIDSGALAIEIKSSWVEASTVPNPENYFTVMATIPVYNKTSNQWTPSGKTKTVKMAMVGMHIVGSANGHPEMIWATFEHHSNTPNASYQYVNTNHQVVTVKKESGTGWQFSNSNYLYDSLYNQSHMTTGELDSSTTDFSRIIYTDTIFSKNAYSISPSNTQRTLPWGSAMDSATNQQDKSSSASNSEIISLNNDVKKLFGGNDKRKNYLFMGAAWTAGGTAPNGSSYGTGSTEPGVAIGTSVLANTTMETYFQGTTVSCLFCHNGGNSLSPDALSHIYANIQPLPVINQLMKKKPAGSRKM